LLTKAFEAVKEWADERWDLETLSNNPEPTTASNETCVVQLGQIDGKKILLTVYLGAILMWGIVDHTVLHDKTSANQSAGGVVVWIDNSLDDKLSHDKKYLESRLAILMAGRIAEEIFLDQMTTGAGNDIERATEMAHKMVCEWGMSELGPLSFGKKDEQIFLGREIAQHRDYSEETAIKIDQQVRKLVEDGYSRARAIIVDRSDALVKIAEALLEREVLDGAEVLDLIAGKQLPKLPSNPKPTPSTPDGGITIAPHPSGPIPGMMSGESPQPA